MTGVASYSFMLCKSFEVLQLFPMSCDLTRQESGHLLCQELPYFRMLIVGGALGAAGN